jgi:hypothetical protein
MSKMVVKLIEKGVFDKYGYSRPSLFWDVTWYVLLFFHRRFGTGCRFHLECSSSQGLLVP